MERSKQIVVILLVVTLCHLAGCNKSDPLPSWNEGPTKSAIISFVERVTKNGGRDFVPPAERIAAFDSDGTLWSEQPMPFQVAFAIDRINEIAPKHPEWRQKEPFKSVLAGDTQGAVARGEEEMNALLGAGCAGMTTEEFSGAVKSWLAMARHPLLNRRYTELVFQPMAELIAYLRASGFRTIIVSGDYVDLVRPMAARAFGVTPEQVIGNSLNLKYEIKGGRPLLFLMPENDSGDADAGKPAGIQKSIGLKPIFAAGNSDSDREMIEWVTSGSGARLGMIVHHTDAEREWAYDRESAVGRLDEALKRAPEKKWLVVDMRKDWNVVYTLLK